MMEEKKPMKSYCEQCLWYTDCIDITDEKETCSFFTNYTDTIDSGDELDADERDYFDDLARRQRAYAAIIYSMREEF